MPNIYINEYDRTTAGIGNYINFSVLVPGYVKNDIEGVFDDNGVCEFTSQADFVTKIGKVPAQGGITEEAIAPTRVLKFLKDQAEFDSLRGVDPETGKAVLENNKLYYKSENPDPDHIGRLVDKNFIYKSIYEDLEEGADPEWLPEYEYAIIDATEEAKGRDEVSAYHYGNQIAYELLGLGYTVLYKKLENNLDLAKPEYWQPLKDKSIYDFRYVINGLVEANDAANDAIIKLAHRYNDVNNDGNGRGDCIALVDVDATSYKGKSQLDAISGIAQGASAIPSSTYAAIFAPYVTYAMKADGEYKNKTFPGYFHYLACAARAADTFNEWYAIAGYTRGISNYTIESVGCKLGEMATNTLGPRNSNSFTDKAINLIVKIKNNYYLWGNRTAEKLYEEGKGELKAWHFLNIRQLCTTIKKQAYVTSKQFTFDPNSDVLWINWQNGIRPTLEKMKGDQGIEDYRFVKRKTSKKAVLAAKIRIVPIEAVEDFDIHLTLENSVEGTVVDVDEADE